MKLISGFFGAELTDDGYIMPKVGWAVGDVKDDAVKTKGGSKKTMMAKKKQK